MNGFSVKLKVIIARTGILISLREVKIAVQLQLCENEGIQKSVAYSELRIGLRTYTWGTPPLTK